MDRPLALVVDDEQAARIQLREALDLFGVGVVEAASGPEALESLRVRPVQILIASVDAPGVTTTELVARATRLQPSSVILALTERPREEAALQAVKHGAFDVLEKPVDPGRLRVAVERATRQHRLLEEVNRLRGRLQTRAGYRRLVGRSDAMERVRERIERYAALDAPLLVTGEAGTGKEFAARLAHDMSPRRTGPFATLDCSALPDTVIESEVFGREAGAAAGTGRRNAGLVESAAGGSVFLNEITELAIPIQRRLVDALRSGTFQRSGGTVAFPLDVRLIAASTRDLERAVEEERLLAELYERFGPAIVHMPPLRERTEDIGLLARHFIETICEINDLPPMRISREVLSGLERYSWPGNVGELRNAIEQAVILATDETIRARDLPEATRGGATEPTGEPAAIRRFRDAKKEVIESFEREYLVELLERHGGNVTAAAQQAGMLRSALQRLLRKYDIRSASFRRGRSGKREKPAEKDVGV